MSNLDFKWKKKTEIFQHWIYIHIYEYTQFKWQRQLRDQCLFLAFASMNLLCSGSCWCGLSFLFSISHEFYAVLNAVIILLCDSAGTSPSAVESLIKFEYLLLHIILVWAENHVLDIVGPWFHRRSTPHPCIVTT